LKKFGLLLNVVLLLIGLPSFAQTKIPAIPVGLDAYRNWHLLPMQRPGVRAYMRSTYDRRGGQDDTGHFLFMNEEDDNVTLDVKGKGILYFFRTNHWHGSPWRFFIDGKENKVKETATDNPVNAKKMLKQTSFIPQSPFPEPLAWTWGTTKGANLIWTPMSFQDSLRIAYSRTCYGTGYYIYHLYANPEKLSRPLTTFNLTQEPDRDVIDLINKAGTDIAPVHVQKRTGKVKLDKERITLLSIKNTNAVVRAVKLTLPLQQAIDLERVRLKVTWDNRTMPSIDAPLCLFFGAGTLYNRDNREYLVKGFPINIRYDYARQQVHLACYYPMPFFQSAHFELTGISPGNAEINYEVRYEPNNIPRRHSSYFHATYNDMPDPELGKDLVFLDTKGAEGQTDWSGNFAGTSFIFSHTATLQTLEGDPRFFFDDSQTPQAYGTGTEEWGGGGDYWGGENMTLPFAGHPCGARTKELAQNEKDLIQSAYRFLIADHMPFGKRAVIRFEHGENLSAEHYESVTYWYGLPVSTLVKTDSIDIGNLVSEQKHRYRSPQASAVDTITSRYEWGISTFPTHPWGLNPKKAKVYTPGAVIYPAQTKDGRTTTGISEFDITLDPKNAGALLRRTLDYSYPNQTAKVYVMDMADRKASWQYAGIWYLAGSNTCVFSRPGGELEKRFYDVQTSNRQFRDDEFMLPARLASGRSKLRIKIEFVPDHQLLYPGVAFPKQSAWSELSYTVYSYLLP
jgi:hypothetical protein